MANSNLTRRALMGTATVAAIGGAAAFALRGRSAFGRRAIFGNKTFNRGNSAEPDSLDPHKAQGLWEGNIIGDMFVGLMTEDGASNPVPGAALSYSASSDGLTYTFKLRDLAWSDGKPVTAHDFVFSLRRLMDPKTAGQYAAILYPIKNAEAVNAGRLPLDRLGVRAINDKTLEIAFTMQVPYVAQLFMHFTTYPVPQHVVEKYGDAWLDPAHIVVNGPFVLKEWVPNDHILLAKNPRFYDARTVALDTIYYYPTPDYSAALKRFRAGELDVNDAVPAQEIDWVRTNLPHSLRIAPWMATQYLQFNLTRKPFNDVRVRKAISMAIDREVIATRVMRAGERAAYAFIPPDMPGYPGKAHCDFQSMPMTARVVAAKALLAEAGYNASNPLSFDHNFEDQTDARLVAVALQSMWNAIGAQVNLVGSESLVHYDLMRKQQFSVAWAGWSADYRDPKDWLMLWQTGTRDMNYGRYSDPKFDALIAQSDHTRDPARREILLQQAEQVSLDDVAYAPVYFDVSRMLVSPEVKGWVNNPVAINRSRYVSLDRSLPSV
jgi:oligopeptide transport system substrate-binding protein